MDEVLNELYQEIRVQAEKEGLSELKIKLILSLLKDVIKNGNIERDELLSRFKRIGGK